MENSVENFIFFMNQKQLSESSMKQYLNYYIKIRELEEDYPLDQDVVDVFLQRYKSNLVRSFMKNYLSFIKNKDIEIKTITGRRGLKGKKMIQMLNPQEKEKLFDYLLHKETKWGIIYSLIYDCALRRQEVINMQPKDFEWIDRFDEDESPIRLLIKGKGNRERYVIVPYLLSEMIRIFIKNNELKPEDIMFPVTSSTLSHKFNYFCKKVLGKTYKLHSLRHLKSTQWNEEGKDIIQIKNRLGHASIATTQIYINPDESKSLSKWKEELRKKD